MDDGSALAGSREHMPLAVNVTVRAPDVFAYEN
jgi:hypothetical protein